MSRRAAAAALVLLFLAGRGRAAPDDVEKELAPAIERIYDDRLDEALDALREAGLRHPGHPSIAFYESFLYFQAYLLEDPPTPHTRKLFESLAGDCLRDAERLEKGASGEAQFYEGLSLGIVARDDAAEGRELHAVRLGRRAVGHLSKVREDDPHRSQVDLGLGAYLYYASQAPRFIRRLAAVLLGVRGDRKKGLALIEGAAGRNGPASDEARWMLALIYGSDAEKRWDDAERLLADLTKRYPHNPAFRLRFVYAAERRGRFDEALRWADPDAGWVRTLAPQLQEPARRWAGARAAECLLLSGRKDEAAERLRALSAEKLPSALQGWVAWRLKQAKGEAAVDPSVRPFPWPRTGLPEASP